MITKAKLSLVDAGTDIGDVVSSGNTLSVKPINGDIVTEAYSHFNDVTGVITLGIPGYPEVQIGGILTIRDIPEGRQGEAGYDGADGADGLSGREGEEGHQGCIGPDGPRGRPGRRGPRGQKGATGRKGDQGEKGEEGDTGRFNVFFQDEDPGPVGQGSLWVKRT